jgi:hypothetical protein
MRKLVLATIVVGVAVATSVGVVLGSGGGSTAAIKASADYPTLRMHRVSAPSGGLAGVAAKRPTHRAKVIYLESSPFKLAGGDTDGGTGKCPKRSTAINGYFGEDGDTVVPIFNAVGTSLRKWSIGIKNIGTTPANDANVFVGTVCLKP